jgi:mannose/cellobiose epimerase-like protein (N-acyl-D-glucosamine 2-epimerase family)
MAISAAICSKNITPRATLLPNSLWLEKTGLSWLHATEDENDFAEKLNGGIAVPETIRTLATQARLGYCWAHLAQLFPDRPEFKRAAEKSFRALQYSFSDAGADVQFRVYDHSFFLLFMAWYFRVTGDPKAIRLLMNRYADIERHFDNAGPGGFGHKPPGLRSHNPYMHLLEAMLAAFQSTQDDYWLSQARRIIELFRTRLLDRDRNIVCEFLNEDWSVAEGGRVEIGHQLEWPNLLIEFNEIDGSTSPDLIGIAESLHDFAIHHGFETGLAIDAVNPEGHPIDRRKLLWSQTEAARHFSIRARILKDENAKTRAAEQWQLIHQHFFHPNGWTWYNSLTADNMPVEEPSFSRLLYHVVTAAAEAS